MSKQKYEQEIEEILKKYEDEKGRKEPGAPSGRIDAGGSRTPRAPIDFREAQSRRASNPLRTSQKRSSMPNWKRLSAGQYIAMAVGAAVLAVLLGKAIPVLGGVLVILSAVLFCVPFVLYRSTGTTSGGYSSTEEKRWRGQPIDYSPRHDVTPNDDDPLAGIKRWFRKR
ncbi:MAG TPA: hypothetical protein VLQ48_04035 [Chloroflexia bacterium]|nr:hypothetical protein [Chloroflexia bacterium]